MKILTTYFANLKKLPSNVVPIAICGKSPDSYKGLEYKKLAPKYHFFMKWKQDHDNDEYTRCFKEQVLDVLSPQVVIQELSHMSNGRDIALVCYEKSRDFCHRHIVSSWLMANGILSFEWQENEKALPSHCKNHQQNGCRNCPNTPICRWYKEYIIGRK